MVRVFSSTKRHTLINSNKQEQSPSSTGNLNAIKVSEKSKREKVRSLSAVEKALSTNQIPIPMGCPLSDSHQPNAASSSSTSSSNKFNLPTESLNHSNAVPHASVPRKIRSAVKKRSRESMLCDDSEKVKHVMNGVESARKGGIKKSKKRRRPEEWSTRHVLGGPITKDEQEVVETLYALAGMFPHNASNSNTQLCSQSSQHKEETHSANATIQASGERCEKNSSLNETIGQEQSDFHGSEKLLVATHSTVPEINGGKVELHDSELSLEMGLNVPAQSQLGRQSHEETRTAGDIASKQEQHIIKYQKETEGLALWPGLSPWASAGNSASYLQSSATKAPDGQSTAICASGQDLMESCFSGGKIPEIVIRKKTRKRSAAHVYISHLIRSLEMPEKQAGKEAELDECPQMRVQRGSNCEALMEAHNLNWMRNGHNSATGPAPSAATRNSLETKNDILQQQDHYHNISQAPTSGLYGLHKQSFNFLSLSIGGNELKFKESFNKGDSKLEPLSKSQVPYFQSLQQQHGLLPIQSQYTSTSFLDQLPVAGQQVRLQQGHYYGSPLSGTHYSSTVSYKQQQQQQQHQSFWAVQLVAQGGSAGNCSNGRAQYHPNWQNGRHDSCAASPYAQVILPHSPASLEELGSKITSISEQQLLNLASSLNLNPVSRFRPNGLDMHFPSSACDESKGSSFLSSSGAGTPSLQLLCEERI